MGYDLSRYEDDTADVEVESLDVGSEAVSPVAGGSTERGRRL